MKEQLSTADLRALFLRQPRYDSQHAERVATGFEKIRIARDLTAQCACEMLHQGVLQCRHCLGRRNLGRLRVQGHCGQTAPVHLAVRCQRQGRELDKMVRQHVVGQLQSQQRPKFAARRQFFARGEHQIGHQARVVLIGGFVQDSRRLNNAWLRKQRGLHLSGFDAMTPNFQLIVGATQ